MTAHWERYLQRWTHEKLIDPASAARIRAFETKHQKNEGLRWPVLLAIAFGGLLLGAGVLLFVAAHWDTLSPGTRFALVLFLVAVFHLAAAVAAGRFPVLSTTLHAVGSTCLGAGIFLAGQIFHLQAHWPAGVLLWALGVWIAYAILRDWPQGALAAVLTPMWLGAEWIEATRGRPGVQLIVAAGILLLSITYLTALLPGKETSMRKALAWIGGLTLMPAAFVVIGTHYRFDATVTPQLNYRIAGWLLAILLPLLLAWCLRRGAAWMNGIAALWVLLLGTTGLQGQHGESLSGHFWHELGPYVMCVLGASGLIAWGLRESRKERINLGVAAFALTVLFFYFSSVMDKLGRSASLIGLGLLFLLGGWLLEKTRRRLVARLGAT